MVRCSLGINTYEVLLYYYTIKELIEWTAYCNIVMLKRSRQTVAGITAAQNESSYDQVEGYIIISACIGFAKNKTKLTCSCPLVNGMLCLFTFPHTHGGREAHSR